MTLQDARSLAWPPKTHEVARYCALAEALEQREWSFSDVAALAGVLKPFIDWAGGCTSLQRLAWEFYSALVHWHQLGTAFEATPHAWVRCTCFTLASMARAAACGYPTDSVMVGGPFVTFEDLAGLPRL